MRANLLCVLVERRDVCEAPFVQQDALQATTQTAWCSTMQQSCCQFCRQQCMHWYCLHPQDTPSRSKYGKMPACKTRNTSTETQDDAPWPARTRHAARLLALFAHLNSGVASGAGGKPRDAVGNHGVGREGNQALRQAA